ncbi:hypothetical protein [Brevibacillus choshinensis]|uniref:Uncharacterized protein n=1 Tax=Brevibacillus choshinensis TaxID=54911 RepID=A0ABX7FLG5_BRECH|nr:hypothetical protein [Brevibacillus choshinensis]QRG66926.1 hypothetical protein JNE38_26185 [Brevibacillus choshinensis]
MTIPKVKDPVSGQWIAIAAATNHSHENATPLKSGFMSADDKKKTDEFNVALFKSLVGAAGPSLMAFGSTTDFSTAVPTTTLSESVARYRNLTINSGHTLKTTEPIQVIYVSGTLTLNGTISSEPGANVAGPNNAGAGGRGGGLLLVIANTIVGNGKIISNGANGGNATAGTGTTSTEGNRGPDGQFFGFTAGGGSPLPPTNTVATVNGAGVANALSLLLANLSQLVATDMGAGTGGSGSSDYNTSGSVARRSGGGGAGAYGNGGTMGYSNVNPPSDTGNGGGGGGGGGIAAVVSPNPIPAIAVEAKGGNGGNAIGTNSPGGAGGGGGIVYQIAPSSLATVSVEGGQVGANTGSLSGAATVGGAGLSRFYPITA